MKLFRNGLSEGGVAHLFIFIFFVQRVAHLLIGNVSLSSLSKKVKPNPLLSQAKFNPKQGSRKQKDS